MLKENLKQSIKQELLVPYLVGTPSITHYIVLTDKHIAYGIKVPAYYKQRFAVCRNSEAPKQPSGQSRICYVFNPKVWLDSISEL